MSNSRSWAIPPWPAGVEVTVFIDPGYTTAQITAIKAAFTNWQDSPTNSGVTFAYTSTQGSGTYRFNVLKDSAPVAGVRAEVTNFALTGDYLFVGHRKNPSGRYKPNRFDHDHGT